MKRRGIYILFSLMLTSGWASQVMAQDAGMSDIEIVEETAFGEEEKDAFVPGEEVRFVPKTLDGAAGQDSLALQMQDFPMRQATMKAAEKQEPAKPKDDSILTFNFLYYIIQKYKLQDIID